MTSALAPGNDLHAMSFDVVMLNRNHALNAPWRNAIVMAIWLAKRVAPRRRFSRTI